MPRVTETELVQMLERVILALKREPFSPENKNYMLVSDAETLLWHWRQNSNGAHKPV